MKKVVIVEDHEDIARLQKRYLEEKGDQVTVITTGFAQVLTPSPMWAQADAAVVDYHLATGPTSGGDVLVWLASNYPAIRRVASTAAGGMLSDLEDVAHVVLYKPYAAPTLYQAIHG
jgi:CheY-like chemotaxis protein